MEERKRGSECGAERDPLAFPGTKCVAIGLTNDGGWGGWVQVVMVELQKELLPLALHKVREHWSTTFGPHALIGSHLHSSWVESSW